MLAILRIMLNQAVKRGLLQKNPGDGVERVREEVRAIELLTPEEVRRIFAVEDLERLWKGTMYYTANLLSATTGLRIGEIQGFKGRYLFDDYAEICAQYNAFHEYTDTKTHDTRYVTIPPVLASRLSSLKEVNGDGYLFSSDGEVTPISRSTVYRHLQYALAGIGIDGEEQRRRNITFHTWRHFFNTVLRMGNVADSKIRKLTGHKSTGMTELYTHFDPRMFSDVRSIQARIAQGKIGLSEFSQRE